MRCHARDYRINPHATILFAMGPRHSSTIRRAWPGDRLIFVNPFLLKVQNPGHWTLVQWAIATLTGTRGTIRLLERFAAAGLIVQPPSCPSRATRDAVP